MVDLELERDETGVGGPTRKTRSRAGRRRKRSDGSVVVSAATIITTTRITTKITINERSPRKTRNVIEKPQPCHGSLSHPGITSGK